MVYRYKVVIKSMPELSIPLTASFCWGRAFHSSKILLPTMAFHAIFLPMHATFTLTTVFASLGIYFACSGILWHAPRKRAMQANKQEKMNCLCIIGLCF